MYFVDYLPRLVHAELRQIFSLFILRNSRIPRSYTPLYRRKFYEGVLLDQQAGTVTQPIRVLIADDHSLVREALRRALSEENFVVVGMAPDGQAAVEMASSLCPDIVLMDYTMPVLNGAEATRQILQANPAIVVIGLSSHDGGGVPEEMRNAGVVAYILKCSGFGDLVATIRNHSRQSDLEQPTPS